MGAYDGAPGEGTLNTCGATGRCKAGLPESSPRQQIVELRSQYRNTDKILAFMNFQFKFVEKVKETIDKPKCRLLSTFMALKADPPLARTLPKPLPRILWRKTWLGKRSKS